MDSSNSKGKKPSQGFQKLLNLKQNLFKIRYPIYSWFHIFGVYTRSMETIYLSLRAQVAVGTFFMNSPVP